jgi:hypothetical protein
VKIAQRNTTPLGIVINNSRNVSIVTIIQTKDIINTGLGIKLINHGLTIGIGILANGSTRLTSTGTGFWTRNVGTITKSRWIYHPLNGIQPGKRTNIV